MSAGALSLVLGVVSGVLAVVLMQAWPPRHRWSREIACTVGEESGLPIHRVKLTRGRRRIWKRRRSPMDVEFRARIAVSGLNRRVRSEVILNIPVEKEWRPVISRSVLMAFRPHDCVPRELRYFPEHIRIKRAEGTLRLDDLLALEGTELRVYVFAYRPYTGTRWMRRQRYTAKAIKPGRFRGTTVEVPLDGRPPREPDFPGDGPSKSATAQKPWGELQLGRWVVVVRRDQRRSG